MPLTITKEVTWHMAHRLQHHKGKCKNLHGHTYRAKVTVGDATDTAVEDVAKDSAKDPETGMLLDFADLKHLIWSIVEQWDHAVMLESTDPLATLLMSKLEELRLSIPGVYLVPSPPTAEYLAETLFWRMARELQKLRDQDKSVGDLYVHSVTVYETDTSYATYDSSE